MKISLNEFSNRMKPILGVATAVVAFVAILVGSLTDLSTNPFLSVVLAPATLIACLLWGLLAIAYGTARKKIGARRWAPLAGAFLFAWLFVSGRLSAGYVWIEFIVKKQGMESVALTLCSKEISGGDIQLSNSDAKLSVGGRVKAATTPNGCFVYFKNFDGILGRSSGYLFVRGNVEVRRYGIHQGSNISGLWYHGETFSMP